MCCACLKGQNSVTQSIDFRDYNISALNNATDWVQTVFNLPASRMQGGSEGVRLAIDVNDPGPYNYTYRSELREQNINVPVPANTSQVYHMQFEVNELPDLFGPVTIFQRFNRDNDGPDIEVELTGKNQFSNAVPNDLQVVAFNTGRQRLGKFLKPINDLKVIIYTSRNGKYKVSLNGETLSQGEGINTLGASAGTWSQFGIYPHGLHDERNRQDQKNSGNTQVSFTYYSYSKTEYEYEVNLESFTTVDLNDGDPGPGPGPGPLPGVVDTCSGDSPQGWDVGDIGNPSLSGDACENGAVIEMRAGGVDIWDTKDEFHYVYKPLTGDIEIKAKVLAIGNSHFWAKGGLMIREGLAGNAKNIYMCMTREGRWSFQRRAVTGDSTRSTKSDPGTISFSHYLRVIRRGDWFYGYHSPDSSNWIAVDSIEMPMTGNVYVGLASSSHDAGTINASTFEDISIGLPPPVYNTSCVPPIGWEEQDLGAVAYGGEVCVEGDELHVSASGADIWSTEDQFFYVYKPLLGNWEVTTRVLEIGDSDAWAKAGLMIRESLTADSKNAFMASTAGQISSFQYRLANAGPTAGTINSTSTFVYPHYLKLERRGQLFKGYYSIDALSWDLVDSVEIAMPDEILLGIAASSHNNLVLNRSRFDLINYAAISGGPGTFPVEFVDFYGIPNAAKGEIELKWEVAMEQGNDYFTVEKSLDGFIFESLDLVDSKGNTQQLRNYSYTDKNPQADKNIYRLKQTDLDGKFAYSPQIEVSLSGEPANTLVVYPSPTLSGDALNLELSWYSNSLPLIEFRDLLGRLLYSKKLDAESILKPVSIDTAKFQSGLYYITVLDPGGYEAPLSKKVYIQ